MTGPHMLVSLNGHGYGHAAMTAPVVAAVRRLRPELRITLQTAAPPEWLRGMFGGDVLLLPPPPEVGACMRGPLAVDADATAAAYRSLHAELPTRIAEMAEQMRAIGADLVLSNISYLALAAARRAGIPGLGLSCLDWAAIYGHFCAERPEAPRIVAEMRAAYADATMIMRTAPSMPMELPAPMRDTGPVARRLPVRGGELRRRLGLPAEARVGVVGFGGIDLPLAFAEWPRLAGWHWLTVTEVAGRSDLIDWRKTGWSFDELLVSADVAVTKPGYGTFTLCAVHGVPVLYLERDWPEAPYLIRWMQANARCLPITVEALLSPALADSLRMLFSLPDKPLPEPFGVAEAAGEIVRLLG